MGYNISGQQIARNRAIIEKAIGKTVRVEIKISQQDGDSYTLLFPLPDKQMRDALTELVIKNLPGRLTL